MRTGEDGEKEEDRKEEETESGPRIQKAKVSPQVTGQSEREAGVELGGWGKPLRGN